MSEFKHGDLKSGSGGKVKKRKQAVAIALNEARSSGAKIPAKRANLKRPSRRSMVDSPGRSTPTYSEQIDLVSSLTDKCDTVSEFGARASEFIEVSGGTEN